MAGDGPGRLRTALLIAGLLGLGGLLFTVGVVLLVTRDVAVADNVSSVLSLALGTAVAGVSLVFWYRTSWTERLARRRAQELATVRAGPADHWLRSARGADSGTGFFFTGRGRVLTDLATVARADEPGLAVLLGMPGAGKSAVMGMLVLRSRAPGEVPAELVEAVPDVSVDCAVHARGKGVADLVAELNEAFGVVAVDAPHEQETLFRAVQDELHTPVVLVDAVDEASSPGAVATFLTQLSWRAIVLVGTRPDEVARPGTAARPPKGMRSRAASVVDLSAAENVERGEIAGYVRARLRADPRPRGYADARGWSDEVLVEIIGREVAAGADDNFLVAQLITDELLSRPPVRARSRGWSDALDWPADFAGWMDRDLDRRLGAERRWLAEALIPLAFVERDGLPIDLWVAVAAAMDLDPRIDAGQISGALGDLGFFISESGDERGPAVERGYQLRHERFADYFRRGPLAARRQNALADVVLGSVARTGTGTRRWWEMRPYTRRNLLAHAWRAHLLDELLTGDPRLLAAVDTTAALDAVSRLQTAPGRELARVLRRAAYGADASYGERCARLEFHARLAGSPRLADRLRLPVPTADTEAGTAPWGTPWRAGGPSAALPDGDPLATKAVLPVDWPFPAAVVIDEDFHAEVVDLGSRSPLGPRVALRGADDGAGPDTWSALEIAGSVYLGVAWEYGRVDAWCLAGPSASPLVVASEPTDAVRSVDVVEGPGGVPLLAVLTGKRPGALVVWVVAEGRLTQIVTDGVLGGDHLVALPATGAGAGMLLAAAGSGLREVVLHPESTVPTTRAVTDEPTTLLAVAGDARAAVALVSMGQEIRAVVLRESRAEILQPALGEGGPSARPALWCADGAARAAVVVDGNLALWNLLPRVEQVGTEPSGSDARVAQFVDPFAALVALSDFAGDVRILASTADGLGDQRSTLPVAELGTVVMPVPAGRPGPVTVVTRAPSGTTKVWRVDDRPTEAVDPINPITALAACDGPYGSLVATDGTRAVRTWRLGDTPAGQVPDTRLMHAEDVEAVAVAADQHTSTVVAVGDSQATMWTVPAGSVSARTQHSWAVPEGLTEDLAVVPVGPHALVVAGGPEGLHLWRSDAGESTPVPLAGLPIPTTSCAVLPRSADSAIVLAADEEDTLHLITIDSADRFTHRRVRSADEVVTRCLMLTDASGAVVPATVSYAGAIRVWDSSGPDVVVRDQVRLPEQPELVVAVPRRTGSLLAFTAPAGIMLWDPLGDSEPALVRTGLRRPNHLVVVNGNTDPRILCAYTSGTVAVIDPGTGRCSRIELNCEFSHMVGTAHPGWAVGTHGSALIAVHSRSGPASGSTA